MLVVYYKKWDKGKRKMRSLKTVFIGVVAIAFCVGAIFFITKYRRESVSSRQLYPISIRGKKLTINLAERMDSYKVPAVSMAIIDNGTVAWAQAYGTTCLEKGAQKVNEQTLFQAGSISKSVNAIGALLLVQQGKLSLDDDVNKYLKSWKVPENEFTKHEKVTLRRLLSHSAGTSVHGFPGYEIGEYVPTLVEVLEGKKPHVYTEPICVTSVPGKKLCYSGGGITIVQLLIEDVTGQPFDIWMKQHVLVPFGMTQSTFGQPVGANVACGYFADGKMVPGKWHVYPEKAAAGLWTTPTDLAHFVITLCNILHDKQDGPLHKNLAQEAVSVQFRTSCNGGSGLGFFIGGSEKNISFEHGGKNEGFLADLTVYPERGEGWVIMVNSDGASGLMKKIAQCISDAYEIPGPGLGCRISSTWHKIKYFLEQLSW